MGASTVLVVACDQKGIEGALIEAVTNVTALRSLGVDVRGVILNKLYISYMTKEIQTIVEQAFTNVGVKLLGMVPRLNLEHRGMIPEVEIRYEDFAPAIEAIRKSRLR